MTKPLSITVSVHNPGAANFDLLDSGTTWLSLAGNPIGFPIEVNLFFDDPATTREWLIAALADIDSKLGLVRAEP